MASELHELIAARIAELLDRRETDPEAVRLHGFYHAIREASLFDTFPQAWLLRAASTPDLSVDAPPLTDLRAAVRASFATGEPVDDRVPFVDGELAGLAALLRAGLPEPQLSRLVARWSFAQLARDSLPDRWRAALRGLLADRGFSPRYVDAMLAADRKQDGASDTLWQRFDAAIDTGDDALLSYHQVLCTTESVPDAWLVALSERPPPPSVERSPLAALHRSLADPRFTGALAAYDALLGAGVPEAVVLCGVDEKALDWLAYDFCRDDWRAAFRAHLEARGYGREYIDAVVAEARARHVPSDMPDETARE
jgi:hypothetical protein